MNPVGYNKLRSMRFENADEVDILDCLDLMKEMATVLEFYASPENYELRWIRLNIKESVRHPRIGETEKGEKALAILNKYKEWK